MGGDRSASGGESVDPGGMSQLSEDAVVRRLGDRFGFGLAGNALLQAQQRGLTATLENYMSPSGADAGADQTPPPELPWIPRPHAAGSGKPSRRRRRRGAGKCASSGNSLSCGGWTGWCKPIISLANE